MKTSGVTIPLPQPQPLVSHSLEGRQGIETRETSSRPQKILLNPRGLFSKGCEVGESRWPKVQDWSPQVLELANKLTRTSNPRGRVAWRETQPRASSRTPEHGSAPREQGHRPAVAVLTFPSTGSPGWAFIDHTALKWVHFQPFLFGALYPQSSLHWILSGSSPDQRETILSHAKLKSDTHPKHTLESRHHCPATNQQATQPVRPSQRAKMVVRWLPAPDD